LTIADFGLGAHSSGSIAPLCALVSL
jgi:hypothetical protein